MTLVDYETKVYNTYIIKEDTGFTDEEKLKAAYSGILGYWLFSPLALPSQQQLVPKSSMFENIQNFSRIHSLILSSFITAGTSPDHKTITLCVQFFPNHHPSCNHQMFVPEHFSIQNLQFSSLYPPWSQNSTNVFQALYNLTTSNYVHFSYKL